MSHTVYSILKFLAACDQICTDPLTSTPFGSPCGCVFPMKIRLTLDIAPYAVFPVMTELENEIALGTYLEQSQVKIMGATADSQNQGRTIVDINLVPLGEKFDNTTAALTYERFWHKKVPLNRSLFGDYAVVYIIYPGSCVSEFLLITFYFTSIELLSETKAVCIRNAIIATIWIFNWERS